MIAFDATIHLSDILIFGGGLLAFVKMFISFRDIVILLKREIGTKEPREGIKGDIVELQETAHQHDRWLIEARAHDPQSSRTRTTDR
jgi:hypothetical protein